MKKVYLVFRADHWTDQERKDLKKVFQTRYEAEEYIDNDSAETGFPIYCYSLIPIGVEPKKKKIT